jgi:hypothetical protein
LHCLNNGHPERLFILCSKEHPRANDIAHIANELLAGFRAHGEWFKCSNAIAEEGLQKATYQLESTGVRRTKPISTHRKTDTWTVERLYVLKTLATTDLHIKEMVEVLNTYAGPLVRHHHVFHALNTRKLN